MKKIFVILILAFMSNWIIAQDNHSSLEVSVSRDSILLGNSFEVTFTLKNGHGSKLPNMTFKDFDVIMGPSSMTSTSVINGAVSSSSSISYVLRPSEVGQYFIDPITVEVDNQYLETIPMEINVYPNPEGIIQEAQKKRDASFDFFFSNPFDELKEFEMPIPIPGKAKKKKKKRKTTRL